MRKFIAVSALFSFAALASPIEFIGAAAIPGSSLDLSGLTETITFPAGSMPHNLLGGFGSGIAYTGSGNRFIVAPDRGPGDGAPSPYYFDRVHTVDLTVDPATKTVGFNLTSTKLLTNTSGGHLVGQSSDFVNRFDPEGIRVAPDGTFYVSDEYGPNIYHFDASGKQIGKIAVPDKFKIANPNADTTLELTGNTAGRQANRGMEGLAISPDGKYLYGIMQNSLIQDGSFDPGSTTRRGMLNRILKVNLETGETSEYLYELDRRQNGVNELLAINDHEFLVIERDGDAGTNATYKYIYKIDINGATDVSGINALPRTKAGLPAGTQIASKSLFIDLLDPAYGLAGADFPEKIEGLAFGPELSDGRIPLYVTSDNDFNVNQPSRIYAFAIEKSALPGYEAQQFVPEPSTFALAGIALLAVGTLRRRR